MSDNYYVLIVSRIRSKNLALSSEKTKKRGMLIVETIMEGKNM